MKPVKISFSKHAEDELDRMDAPVRRVFLKHAEKIAAMPPRRHLRFGLPFNVEDATRQARLVYEIKGGNLTVLHCFSSHKDYEKWYQSFK